MSYTDQIVSEALKSPKANNVRLLAKDYRAGRGNDDHDLIQRALDDVSSYGGGYVIGSKPKAGKYVISAELNIHKNTRFVSPAGSILQMIPNPTGTRTSKLLVTDAGATDIWIAGWRLDGNSRSGWSDANTDAQNRALPLNYTPSDSNGLIALGQSFGRIRILENYFYNASWYWLVTAGVKDTHGEHLWILGNHADSAGLQGNDSCPGYFITSVWKGWYQGTARRSSDDNFALISPRRHGTDWDPAINLCKDWFVWGSRHEDVTEVGSNFAFTGEGIHVWDLIGINSDMGVVGVSSNGAMRFRTSDADTDGYHARDISAHNLRVYNPGMCGFQFSACRVRASGLRCYGSGAPSGGHTLGAVQIAVAASAGTPADTGRSVYRDITVRPWIDDATGAVKSPVVGNGVHAEIGAGSVVELTQVRVEQAGDKGVWIVPPASPNILKELVVDDVTAKSCAGNGIQIDAGYVDVLRYRRNHASSNGGVGMTIASGVKPSDQPTATVNGYESPSGRVSTLGLFEYLDNTGFANTGGDLSGVVVIPNYRRGTALPAPAAETAIPSRTVTAGTTLQISDAGQSVAVNSASAQTVTVPPSSSVPFPLGTVVEVMRYGAGAVTVAAGAGVTIRHGSGPLTISDRYGSVRLRQYAIDEWILLGSGQYQAQMPALAAPANPLLVTSSAASAANRINAVRVVIPRTGTLTDLSVCIATSSGNVRGLIYDTSATTRNLLFDSGSVASAAGWLTLGALSLAVNAGDQLDFAVQPDNATVTLGRWTAASTFVPNLPLPFWVAAGGGKPLLSWFMDPGSFAAPATIAEASISVATSVFYVMARVT